MSSNVIPLKPIPILLRYLKPQTRNVLLLAALLLSSIGLQLWVPQIMRSFIDAAQQKAPLEMLTRAAFFYLFAAIVNQLLSAGATFVGANVGWTATNLLRSDLMKHVLTLDMSFHKDHSSGEMIERIDGDVTALSNFFSQFSVRVFGAVLLLVGVMVMFWRENIWAGLAISSFTILVLSVLLSLRKVAVGSTEREREANAQMYGFIEERLAGLEDIRALGAGHHTMKRFWQASKTYYHTSRTAHFARASIWLAMLAMFAVGYVGALALGVGLFAAGVVTLGTAYLFFQYMSMVEDPIDQITQQLQELQKVGASLQRIGDLLSLRSSLTQGSTQLPSGALSLEFDQVDFGYGEKNVLSGIDFTLEPGKILGLLGRTGSGKTTLTRLILRLYDPTHGTVRLGGVQVASLERKSLRDHVAVVTQDVQLFHASVRDNLSFFDKRISDAQMQQVLLEIGLSPWFSRLPSGLDTVLESGGVGLSAGEGQLLALARVFLCNPGLIILDEPSSRLDPASEALLEQAITRLLVGRTAIIIAHRLETVQRSDQILVLGQGQILEFGTREVLANNPKSHFAELLRVGSGDLLEGGSVATLEDVRA